MPLKVNDEVDRLQAKLAEAMARLGEAEQAVKDAPAADARSLACWLAAGEKGERPGPSLYERQRERGAAQLLLDAVHLELDRALAARVGHVERHRGKLAEQAREAVETAHGALQDGARRGGGGAWRARRRSRPHPLVQHFPGPEANRTCAVVPSVCSTGWRRPPASCAAAVAAALEADADTLRTDLERGERDPGDMRQSAQWLQTLEGDQALTDEKKRIIEAMKPRNVHAAGWEK